MKNITTFTGEYYFLSNFYPISIVYKDEVYTTVEHAFQASKTTNESERLEISNTISPAEAKRLGQRVHLVANWEFTKVRIMKEILQEKFNYKYLADKLIATKDAELIEGNLWGDSFWGVCNKIGQNQLGKLLMEIRKAKQ